MDVLRSIVHSDHYFPHSWAKFEGFYSKFELPSGARLILVLCSIPRASGKKHNVTIVYVPLDGRNVWKQELFPREMTFHQGRGTFTYGAKDITACMTVTSDKVHYDISAGDVSLKAISSNRMPWSRSSWFDTPGGPLAMLPLPLHWHVHSLGSHCDFELALPPTANQHVSDKTGVCVVHEEKNWANSFPPAHNWVQARKANGSICLAGGRTMGVDAFLLGYRNKTLDLELDLRPPFALKVFGRSPFMTHILDWEQRAFHVSVQNFRYKVIVDATAPKGTFFSLSAPMTAGFLDNYMGESLSAHIKVRVLKRNWPFGSWNHVCFDEFFEGALEFGAGYYPMRGTEQRIN